MTVHDPEELTAHALGLLDGPEARAVDEHLRGCGDCRAEWAQVRETSAMLATVPPETLADGPPLSDLALRRALRRIDDEAGPRHRRAQPRTGRLLAAAVAALALVAGGAVVGRLTAPQPATSTVAAPGSRTVEGSQGAVRMTATITPAAGWVRLAAAVQGIAPGQRCTLLVIGRDGTASPAARWVTSPPTELGKPTPIAGSAIVEPDQVSAVAVRNDAGETLVSLPVRA